MVDQVDGCLSLTAVGRQPWYAFAGKDGFVLQRLFGSIVCQESTIVICLHS